MNLKEQIKQHRFEEIWQEYCGFLDLNITDYMKIQERLMLEQMSMWSGCELGKKILGSQVPKTIEDFLSMVPLTSYEDYADILLHKKSDMLPAPPVVWLQTTWEGGIHPIKLAPYTKGMLDTYKTNLISALIISTASKKGDVTIHPKDKVLYGFAPLPYLTGLIPPTLEETIGFEFLPPQKQADNLSFGQRNKLGFKLGFAKGIDYLFGMGSVIYYISQSLSSVGSGTRSANKELKIRYSPKMLFQILKAKYICKKEGRALIPKDIFKLKGCVCAGTDNACYKDELEELWGIRPREIFAGTEPTLIGVETWRKDGLYFFPDACFYEFIPENEISRSTENKPDQPRTVLMDQVVPGEKYELVISVLKGGAFVRYCVGDVYQCMGLFSNEDDIRIPRFRYVDRVPTIIDIAGFTRISKKTIQNVIHLSGLPIQNWFAAKEFTKNNKPFLHMYIEMKPDALVTNAISNEIIRDHMKVYFKYLDSDYDDLKVILGLDPLEITLVRCGTFEAFRNGTGRSISHINPPLSDIREFLRVQSAF